MSLTTVSAAMTSGLLQTANNLAELASTKTSARTNIGVDPSIPLGTVMLWAGSTVPTDWVQCNGSGLSQTTYASLYAVVGNTFNTGSQGPNDFLVPNLTALSSGNVKYIIKTGPAVA
jgi:hypothetical protein